MSPASRRGWRRPRSAVRAGQAPPSAASARPAPAPGVVAAGDRFRERAQADRRRPRRVALAVAAALVVVLLLGWVVRFSPLLDVRAVDVQGAPGTLAATVEKAAAAPMGSPLAGVDLTAIGQRVAGVAGVESVRVGRAWPHTVRVEVTPRTPVLALSQGGVVRLVDASGVAFATVASAPQGVPTVAADRAGEGAGLAGAVAMMSALPADLRARVSKVELTSASAMAFTLGGDRRTTVRWGDSSQPELKVKVLRALLQTRADVVDVSAPQAPATS